MIKHKKLLLKASLQETIIPYHIHGVILKTVFVYVPMHLLYLGIVKNVMLKGKLWLELNFVGSTFVDSVKGILKLRC